MGLKDRSGKKTDQLTDQLTREIEAIKKRNIEYSALRELAHFLDLIPNFNLITLQFRSDFKYIWVLYYF